MRTRFLVVLLGGLLVFGCGKSEEPTAPAPQAPPPESAPETPPSPTPAVETPPAAAPPAAAPPAATPPVEAPPAAALERSPINAENLVGSWGYFTGGSQPSHLAEFGPDQELTIGATVEGTLYRVVGTWEIDPATQSARLTFPGGEEGLAYLIADGEELHVEVNVAHEVEQGGSSGKVTLKVEQDFVPWEPSEEAPVETAPADPIPPADPSAMRTWSDVTGKYKIEARFLELADGKVRLEKADGQMVNLPLEKLCEADQQFVKSIAAGQP